MRKDIITTKPIYSSFLSCEKDVELLIKTLFIDSKPYSDKLKRLLVINAPDCLDESINTYQEVINNKSLSDLRKEGYIRLSPKIKRGEHEEIKSYILITFDNFAQNRNNPKYRDCTVNFDIVCFTDEWELEDYKTRPLAIVGYIDGILNSLTNKNKQIWNGGNNIRLSGIGEYEFLSCDLAVLNEDISMYSLSYRALHFTEDNENVESITT